MSQLLIHTCLLKSVLLYQQTCYNKMSSFFRVIPKCGNTRLTLKTKMAHEKRTNNEQD